MPWGSPRFYEPYFYTANIISCIANSYHHIYEGIEFYRKGLYRYTLTNPFEIAEYKIDFERALASLSYRRRKVIELYMEGYTDDEIQVFGFTEVEKFRWSSFGLMARFLNKGEIK
jgi:hypothetical protein